MSEKEIIRKEIKSQLNFIDPKSNPYNKGRWNELNHLLLFIDSMQEEPVRIKKECKYLCLGDMRNNDTGKISFIGGKIYLAPEDDTLVSEENGWCCDTSENSSNFKLVEEPVSEDMWEASKQYALRQVLASTDTEMSEQAYLDLRLFSGLELAIAHRDGANWQKEQMMAKAIEGGCFSYKNGFVHISCDVDEHITNIKFGDKVKVIVIKEG